MSPDNTVGPTDAARLQDIIEVVIAIASNDFTRRAFVGDGQHEDDLGAEVRDLYGQLIDGMQGTRGAIRSGGDGGAPLEGARPTQEPMSRYSGVVKVGPDGVARVTFEIPAFNGSARLMAVAWSKSRVGQAATDIIIRDPVVVQATLPRFLALGDQSRFHMQIDNVEGATGDARAARVDDLKDVKAVVGGDDVADLALLERERLGGLQLRLRRERLDARGKPALERADGLGPGGAGA